MDDASRIDGLLAEGAWLRRLALALAGNQADADDVAQESLIAAWRKRPDGTRSLRPWLTKVARDTAGMRRRSDRRRLARDQAAIDDREPARPDELLAQARLHRAVVDAVLELPEPYREVILARYVEGRSAAAIARARGVPESTVRGWLREALERLRAVLDGKHGGREAWAPAVLAFLGRGGGAWPLRIAIAVVAAAAVLLVLVLARAAAPRAATAKTPVATAATSTPAHDAQPARPPSLAVSPTEPRPWWDVPGVTLHPIAGRVVGPDGAPLPGAVVRAFGWSSAVTGDPIATRSDEHGEFRIAPRDATMHQLVASAPGYVAPIVGVDPRAPLHEQDPEAVTIVMERCVRTVEGTIYEPGGAPLEGAAVSASAGSMWPGAVSHTDVRGHYTICVASDAKWVRIGADGYANVLVPIAARVDRTLELGAVVHGRVVDSETGVPVSAAQVFVAGGNAASRAALSDGDGVFVIDGVAAGSLALNVWAGDHGFPDRVRVDVVAGRETDAGAIAVPPARTLRGIVLAKGRPFAGASIRFDTPGPNGIATSLRAVAGADGRFVAVNVTRAPVVTVRVDGALVTRDTIDVRTVDDELVLDVEPLPTLRGMVTRHGAPVAGEPVELSPTRVMAGLNRTRTDSRGRFELPAPPAGTYAIAAGERAVEVVSPRTSDVVIELEP